MPRRRSVPSTASSSDIGGACVAPPLPDWPERDLPWPATTPVPDDPTVEDVFGAFAEDSPFGTWMPEASDAPVVAADQAPRVDAPLADVPADHAPAGDALPTDGPGADAPAKEAVHADAPSPASPLTGVLPATDAAGDRMQGGDVPRRPSSTAPGGPVEDEWGTPPVTALGAETGPTGPVGHDIPAPRGGVSTADPHDLAAGPAAGSVPDDQWDAEPPAHEVRPAPPDSPTALGLTPDVTGAPPAPTGVCLSPGVDATPRDLEPGAPAALPAISTASGAETPPTTTSTSPSPQAEPAPPAAPTHGAPAPAEGASTRRFPESLPLPGPALVLRRDDAHDANSRVGGGPDAVPLPSDPLFRHARPAEIRLGMRALVVGLVTLVLVVALGLAMVMGRGSSIEAAAPATSSAFPGSPPDGMSAPEWATPPLDPRAESPVVDEGRALAYVTADHHIAASGVDGALRWSTDLPSGDVERGPALTTVGGAAALVTHVGGRLIAHAVSDGRIIVDTPMPHGASVSFAGTAPLLDLDPQTAGILTPSGLSRISVPAGLRPLSADSAGTVLAAAPQGWCDLRPDTPAPPLTPWEHLPGTDPRATPVAVIGTSVLLLGPGDHPWIEVQHRAPGMKPLFRAPLEPASGSSGMVWAPAPDRSWGILGSNLVDLEAGRVVGLGRWGTTLAITDSHAYGDDGSTVRIAGPERAPEPVRVRSALVESDAVSGVFTRSKVGDEVRAWFIDTGHRD